MVRITSHPDPGARRLLSSAWLRFVWLPVTVGLLVCGAGVAIAAGGETDGSLVASVLALVGGWAVAYAIINAVAALPQRHSWLAHGALAAVAAAMLLSSPAAVGLLDRLPPSWPHASIAFLALPTAGGWVILTLLSRISGHVRRQAAQRAAAISPADWSDADGRPQLTVTVAPLSLARQILLITSLSIVGGAVAATALVFGMSWVSRVGPTVFILLVGIFILLPLYLIVRGVVNRRRMVLTLRWDPDALSADTGTAWYVPFASLVRLVWQQGTDFARLELHTAERCETYLVGMVRQNDRQRAQLPPLRDSMVRGLEHAGLRSQRSRQGAVLFERLSAHACAHSSRA